MRNFVFSLALFTIFLTCFPGPSYANNFSGDIALKNAAQIQTMKAKQKEFFVSPRSNTPAKCNADFEATFKKMAETTGWIVMYNEANDRSSAPLAGMLNVELVKSRADVMASITNLERLCYPLQNTSQVPTAGNAKSNGSSAKAKGRQ